ncbi:unnamed protein product [Lymnaea stagnalis]|uniref:CBM20 domain-containing protein n=1 Tax=Lymnaea stagnalis TaxID=6523 RepID=A0AAV2I408_LYMST
MKVKSYRSNQIGLQFRVWCPTFNRVRHRLFLLGSLPELGAWNIDAALEALPTTEIHIWKTEAALPASSSFEWVWLRTAPNRTGVEWERFNKRNRTVDCYSGTLHTIWGESDEVFVQSATCLELTTFLSIDDGYTLVLSGSTPSTGLWNLSNALPAKEFPKKSGYWKVQISFDSFANLDFKWAVVKEKDHSIVRIEEKLHHSIYGRRSWMRAVAPWMLPVVVVVDTSILTDPMDNVLGRTDIIVKERRKRQEEIVEWTKVSTKILLEEKKKAEAMGPRFSSSQETLGSLNASGSSEKTKVSSISREPSVDLPRQPTVSATGNLDDLISKREELVTRESKTERLTKQFSKTYMEQVHVLKGLGQTEVPSDPINLEGAAHNNCYLSDEVRPNSSHMGPLARRDSCVGTEVGLRPDKKSVATSMAVAAKIDAVTWYDSSHIAQDKTRKPADAGARHTDLKPERVRKQSGLLKISSNSKNWEKPLQDETSCSDCTHPLSLPRSEVKQVKSECPVSSCVPLDAASDTGFTDASSWLSSLTLVPRRDSSHTPAHCSAFDQHFTTDMDEGYSEAEEGSTLASMVERPAAQETPAPPAQETPAPPETDYFGDMIYGQGDYDLFINHDLEALNEDEEHLEWLALKIRTEDKSCTSKRGLGFELPPDHPILGCKSCSDDVFRASLADILGKVSLSQDYDLTSPTPPIPVPENIDTVLVSVTDDQRFSKNIENYNIDFSFGGAIKARSVARAMEERWGATQQQGQVDSFTADQNQTYFLPPEYSYKDVCYSFTDFCDAEDHEMTLEDHRARARELERAWGLSQGANTSIAEEISVSESS